MLRNGYRLTPDNSKLERFTFAVVNGRQTPDEMAAWFRAHTISVL